MYLSAYNFLNYMIVMFRESMNGFGRYTAQINLVILF